MKDEQKEETTAYQQVRPSSTSMHLMKAVHSRCYGIIHNPTITNSGKFEYGLVAVATSSSSEPNWYGCSCLGVAGPSIQISVPWRFRCSELLQSKTDSRGSTEDQGRRMWSRKTVSREDMASTIWKPAGAVIHLWDGLAAVHTSFRKKCHIFYNAN